MTYLFKMFLWVILIHFIKPECINVIMESFIFSPIFVTSLLPPLSKIPLPIQQPPPKSKFPVPPLQNFFWNFSSQHFGCMSWCLKSFINANLLHTRKTTVKFSHKMQCSKSSPSLNPVQWICTPHVSNLPNSSFYLQQSQLDALLFPNNWRKRLYL